MPPTRGASGWTKSAPPRDDQLARARRRWSASRRSRSACRASRRAARGPRSRRHRAAPRSRPGGTPRRRRHMRCAVGRSHCWLASTISGTPSPRALRTASTRRRSAPMSGCPTLILMPPMPAARDARRRSPALARSASTGSRPRCCSSRPSRDARRAAWRAAGRRAGLEVPQRDVERRDRLRRQAAAPHRRAGPEQLGPQPLDVVRILADQLGRDLVRVRVHARAAGPLRVAEADPFVAVAGRDLGEQERDFGERLLPTGQHLGVAYRRGERQHHVRERDGGDPIRHRRRGNYRRRTRSAGRADRSRRLPGRPPPSCARAACAGAASAWRCRGRNSPGAPRRAK